VTATTFEMPIMDRALSPSKERKFRKELGGREFGEEFPPSYRYEDNKNKQKTKWGYFLRRKFPAQKEGDLLAIMSAGAYGAVMASEYNTRPLIPEVLVDGRNVAVVRRRPTVAEIVQRDSVPDWLRA
jgi:hypothetical protein